MGTIAVDGSKVKANASKHKAMSYDRMLVAEKKLRSEIRKLTQAAREQDDIDDQTFGPDFRGDELPQELSNRKTRLQTIQAAKKRLEERKAAEAAAKKAAEQQDSGDAKPDATKSERVLPEPRDQENFTDPDSRTRRPLLTCGLFSDSRTNPFLFQPLRRMRAGGSGMHGLHGVGSSNLLAPTNSQLPCREPS
jgi:hypothetical protein